MPAWLWRRAPASARVAFVAVLLLGAAAAIALAPGIEQSKRERARQEAVERRAAQARLTRALRAEQRVLRARSTAVVPAASPPATRLAARDRLLTEVQARILADARARRLSGRLRRVSCSSFPRSPHVIDVRRDLRRRTGRYRCLVVTAEIPPSASNSAGLIGHPYRVLVDFRSGRYAYCKISGVPGEGSLSAKRKVTVPRGCGGL